jgi:hypothetical protein
VLRTLEAKGHVRHRQDRDIGKIILDAGLHVGDSGRSLLPEDGHDIELAGGEANGHVLISY